MPGAGRDLRGALGRAVVPVLALVTAFVAGAFLIVLTDLEHLAKLGADPLGAIGGAIDVVIRGYGAMFTGSLGDPARIVAAVQSGNERDIARAIRPATEALLSATPLIFLGLGVGVALHARLFNFGADGQFLIGAMGAALGANALAGSLPPLLILVGAAAIGTLFGAAWGFVPGLLRARTGAHEVITTLMLNTIAFQIVIYVGSNVRMQQLPAITGIPLILDLPTIRLDWGLGVALAMAAMTSFMLFRTRLGFELRATGYSRTAARAAGMRPGRATILAMSISGGLAGMGGALLSLGPAGGIEGTRDGFVALALALLAGLRPSGIVLAALFFGALNNGAKSMVVETGTPLDLLTVVIALALMFVAAPDLIRSIWRRKEPEPKATFEPVGPM
jgi:simple sugar transport system permease protein